MARALVRLLNRGGISVMLLDEEVYAAALELFEQRAETLSLRDAASLQLMKKLLWGAGRGGRQRLLRVPRRNEEETHQGSRQGSSSKMIPL
jgi:hypothetical protein